MPGNLSPLWLRVENLPLTLAEGAEGGLLGEPLRRVLGTRLGVAPHNLGELAVVQRAIDARHQNPRYSYTVDVALPESLGRNLVARNKGRIRPKAKRQRMRLRQQPDGPRPVVVGAGPAGLFAALTLAEAGWAPIIVERGRPVEQRSRDVSRLYSRGELQQDSNVCFGEGGAGTYSDGKLYTRVGDSRIDSIMHNLVALGAKSDILVNNRPHVGTDKLVGILQRLRARLTELGATFRFETALSAFCHHNGRITGLRLRDGEVLPARHVVLATGHSAKEIWHRLEDAHVAPQTRPFAMGFRIEHPQALINEARYGAAVASKQILPAADYKLTHNERDPQTLGPRGVFSFCMCPGGVVVTTPTEPSALCINGMSHASRQGKFANSAMVVSVTPQDFAEAGFAGTYGGVKFQESVERAAYAMGGGEFVAPAARVTDFMEGRISQSLPATSYRRGLNPGPIHELYGRKLTASLRRALLSFNRRIPGFISEEATLIGVETRTAAPVRVPRGEDGVAIGLAGVYPAGEGMGYGGGIVSAAVDGVRAAEAMLQLVGAASEAVAAPMPALV